MGDNPFEEKGEPEEVTSEEEQETNEDNDDELVDEIED